MHDFEFGCLEAVDYFFRSLLEDGFENLQKTGLGQETTYCVVIVATYNKSYSLRIS